MVSLVGCPTTVPDCPAYLGSSRRLCTQIRWGEGVVGGGKESLQTWDSILHPPRLYPWVLGPNFEGTLKEGLYYEYILNP